MSDKININGIEYAPTKPAGPLSIIRTINSGVHIGELESLDDMVCTLKNAVRLWRWRGANTLNEVSQKGVNRSQYTRISEPVPSIILTQAIEIIPVASGVDFSPVWNN